MMLKLGPAAVAAIIILAASAANAQTAAQAKSEPRAPIRAFSLPVIEKLGSDLYQQDREAWVATDLLLEAKVDREAEKLIGWVVAPEGDDDVVHFLRETPTGFASAFEVRFGPGLAPKLHRSDEPGLSEDARLRFTAMRTAAADVDEFCVDKPYNRVVLPDPERPGWLVWLLTPMTQARSFPILGHWRYSITPDGKTIRQRDQLSVACGSEPLPKDARAIMVGHSVSPTPIEIHVFVQYEAKLPVLVEIDDDLWLVEQGKIRKLPPKAAAAK